MSGDVRWRCRRGMRELDELLAHFLDHHYAHLPAELSVRFKDWLELSDPVLWDRLTGPLPENPSDLDLVMRLRAFPGLLRSQD
jgi:antitoxin CptB